MSVRSRLSSYFPDRPPTWSETILLVALLGIIVVPRLPPPSSISWPVVLLAFVITLVVVGPVASTTLAKRFGRWLREMGLESRATILVPVFVVLFVLIRGLQTVLPRGLLDSILLGGIVASFLYLVAHVVVAGEISGWWAKEHRE